MSSLDNRRNKHLLDHLVRSTLCSAGILVAFQTLLTLILLDRNCASTSVWQLADLTGPPKSNTSSHTSVSQNGCLLERQLRHAEQGVRAQMLVVIAVSNTAHLGRSRTGRQTHALSPRVLDTTTGQSTPTSVAQGPGCCPQLDRPERSIRQIRVAKNSI